MNTCKFVCGCGIVGECVCVAVYGCARGRVRVRACVFGKFFTKNELKINWENLGIRLIGSGNSSRN